MKKLEDIPKKDFFEVQDGYFEELPGKIQNRITGRRSSTQSRSQVLYTLRFALPAVVLFAIGIFWFSNSADENSAESILASVQTEDLVAFLDEDDISMDELLEDASLDNQDAEDIEDAVYGLELSHDNFQDILDEID